MKQVKKIATLSLLFCATLSLIKASIFRQPEMGTVYLKDVSFKAQPQNNGNDQYIVIRDGKIEHCADSMKATEFKIETDPNQVVSDAIGHGGLNHMLKYQDKYLSIIDGKLTLTPHATSWKSIDQNSQLFRIIGPNNRLSQAGYNLEYKTIKQPIADPSIPWAGN